MICRVSQPWELIPGEIATIRPRRRWRFGPRQCVSGAVVGWRLDVPALWLTPLRLEPQFDWDPAEEYWGEDDEPLPDWAVPIVERGPRPAFEMAVQAVQEGAVVTLDGHTAAVATLESSQVLPVLRPEHVPWFTLTRAGPVTKSTFIILADETVAVVTLRLAQRRSIQRDVAHVREAAVTVLSLRLTSTFAFASRSKRWGCDQAA